MDAFAQLSVGLGPPSFDYDQGRVTFVPEGDAAWLGAAALVALAGTGLFGKPARTRSQIGGWSGRALSAFTTARSYDDPLPESSRSRDAGARGCTIPSQSRD